MMQILLSTFIVSYLGLCALVYCFQERMVFFPSRHWVATPDQYHLQYRTIQLVSQGKKLSAWHLPHADPAARVLFLHGNAGNISHRLHTLRLLHQLSCETLILDYQGYGQSEGSPGEAATYHDAMSGWEYLHRENEQAGARRPLVVFGRSLGSMIAADLAAQVACDGLILESTFTSSVDLARRLYPLLPVTLLVRIKYDNMAKIAAISCPKLFLHSPQDEVIPHHLGRTLYEAAPHPKSWVDLHGGHHDGFLVSGARYTASLEKFLQEVRQTFANPTAP